MAPFAGTNCPDYDFTFMHSRERAGAKVLQSDMARLDSIRAERPYDIDQIRQSERTIERSRELIKRLDELLAKNCLKP